MDFVADGPTAIPLWMNGHAFLTVCDGFLDVMNPQTGVAIHRVPLAGTDEALQTVAAAQAAQPAWADLGLAARRVYLGKLADQLEEFSDHFATLLRNETGFDPVRANAEVCAALAALRGTSVGANGVAAIVVDATRPLAGLAEAMAPALMAGAALVIKPSPKAPSAAYALCELSARAEWPAGVLNLLQGDTAAVNGLCASEIDRLIFVGAPALGAQIAALAEAAGISFESWQQ
ncbi:MAG: aldehyde dehydrogenase family protein [Rhodocyclaceae bacterium]|nr:aldehyde dehydrogenase family protein [Rhodocyclaceae bacterium]